LRRLLHRINLRTDVPRRVVVEDESKRKPRLPILVAGLFILLLISTFYKIHRKSEIPEIGKKIEVQITHRQSLPTSRPASSTSLQKASPPEAMKKEGSTSIKAPFRGPTAFKGAKTPKTLKQKKREKKGEILVVLFPGKRPKQVKNTLSLRGIAFQEGKRKTTITLWRVMIKASPSTVDSKASKVKGITGTLPWKLTMKGTLYLVVASLSEREEAERLGKALEKAHLKALILPIKRTIELNSLTFHVRKDQWPSLKHLLKKLGVHFLEETPLNQRSSLLQPVSTTSQGKGSSSSLSL